MKTLTLCLLIAGAAVLIHGIAMVYRPAGWIAAGLIMLGTGLDLVSGDRRGGGQQ